MSNLERINSTYSRVTEAGMDRESTTRKFVLFDVSHTECSVSFYMALERMLIAHIDSMKAMMK